MLCTGLSLIFCAMSLHYFVLFVSRITKNPADFVAFYYGASLVSAGRSPYFLTDSINVALLDQRNPFSHVPGVPLDYSGFAYPVFFALAMRPFTLLPLEHAFAAWQLVNQAALVAAFLFTARALHFTGWGRKILLATVWLGFYPLYANLGAGQSQALVLLGLALCLHGVARGRAALAGFGVGVTASIKLTPALFLLWAACRGRWRLVAWALGFIAAGVLIALLAVGWDNQLVYVTRVLPIFREMVPSPPSQSAAAFVERLLKTTPWTTGLVDAPELAATLAGGASLGIVLLALYASIWPRIATPTRDVTQLAMWTTALPLASGFAHDSHLLVLLIPYAVLLHQFATKYYPPVWLFLFGLSYALVGGDYVPVTAWSQHGWGVLFLSARFYGVLILYGLLLALSWQDTAPSRGQAPQHPRPHPPGGPA